jgi:hypothetical protein
MLVQLRWIGVGYFVTLAIARMDLAELFVVFAVIDA